MLVKLKCVPVKVRRQNSQRLKGDDRFTGALTFNAIGYVGGRRIRLALGTEEKTAALRRVQKLEVACADGPESRFWPELEASLPPKTFEVFASLVGFIKFGSVMLSNPTWSNLRKAYEANMEQKIQAGLRGERKHTMVESTRFRYDHTLRSFENFLGNPETRLSTINAGTIEKYKVQRSESIRKLKQSRGGGSIALDIIILHGVFKLAVKQGMMVHNPIDYKDETKPGEYPVNGARSLTFEELTKLRALAEIKPKTELEKKALAVTGGDLFVTLVMRWTGLRASDLVRLSWKHVHFDRGEIEIVPQKTEKRKVVAIIPLSPELQNALNQQYFVRKCQPDDKVLLNPNPRKCDPFKGRTELYQYCLALARRAGIIDITPHDFRDTFAIDMLTRGTGIFQVAQMLADKVETVEKHYGKFLKPMRDAVKEQMASGQGIEEQGRKAQQQDQERQKVVSIR